MKILKRTLAISILSVLTAISILGCSNTNKGDGVTLKIEELPLEGTTGSTDNGQTLGTGDGVLNALFTGTLGVPVSSSSLSNIAADPTGFTVSNDWDADGIPNDQEVTSNPYAADYPRILTRVTTPITMELRKSETNSTENLTEVINKTDTKDTISNSMEDKHYTQANMKTTPYVTKEASSNSSSSASGSSSGGGGGVTIPIIGGGANFNFTQSSNVSNSISQSSSSEKTVFQDVDYTDNLDKNGVEFTNNKVQNMAKNYRQSELSKTNYEISPNAGFVRAGLFLKNDSINMPVKVSEVVCTLSFRTPAGAFLPVKTFKLRNEDYSEFNEEIYGAEELGPYTIEISGLNTHEVKNALANGYVPQIHVVSYKMSRVRDSNYNPGYENLKIAEETAKGRTAQIKIIGPNKRDIYRVAAFDVDSSGRMIPGISLKKALYNILHDRIGNGESWTRDNNGIELTVTDANLKWMAKLDETTGKPIPANLRNTEHDYSKDANGNILKGNSWRMFETYVKTWYDEYNKPHKIETIKRIDNLNQYNPFSPEDNPSYNPNELLTNSEISKFKFWIIYHNGRYFEGDINDPIWAGERFEIVLMDTRDFNAHFENYYYTPLQSMESFMLNTAWNSISNTGEFARSKYLGKIVKGDIMRLQVNIDETRYLMNPATANSGPVIPQTILSGTKNAYYNFAYTFQPSEPDPNGIPQAFSHTVEGKTNRILVKINESQLAQSYDIKFRLSGSQDSWKTVNISANKLAASNYSVNISRVTLDSSDTPVGFIAAGNYDVQVFAKGMYYKVPVSTRSSSNNSSIAVVTDPTINPSTGSGKPGENFSYSVNGGTNSITVRISENGNLESYLIRVTGPNNYPGSIVKEIVGYPGSNRIEIKNPDDPLVVISDPAVYSVDVYAVNNSCYSNGSLDYNQASVSSTGTQFLSVIYDKYSKQKENTAYVSSSNQTLGALDLEVNFNDGSGWYRLKLSSDDIVIGDKVIDCRFTSYMEQDQQKFYVTFKAPSGATTGFWTSIYNIFFGGREETDVYIRTVAESKYKEAFWPKWGSGYTDTDKGLTIYGASIYDDTSYNNGIPCILTNSTLTRDQFIKAWSESSYSDVTRFENSLNASNGVFTLVSVSKSDYLFSPAEFRKYRITAGLLSDFTPTAVQNLDPPTFIAEADGERQIKVYNIASQYGESFDIYWMPTDSTEVPTGGIGQFPWDHSPTAVLPDNDGNYVYYIGNTTPLIPNWKYAVAVVARNSYGVSMPSFYKNAAGDLWLLTPHTAVASTVKPTFALNLGLLGSNNKYSVYVTGITAPGECRYRVYYKTEAEPDTAWHMIDTYSANDPSTVVYSPTTVTIPNVNSWVHLQVKTCAVTLGGVEGVMSDVQTILTPLGFYEAPSINKIVYGWCDQGHGGVPLFQYRFAEIKLFEEAISVRVKVTYDYAIGHTYSPMEYEWYSGNLEYNFTEQKIDFVFYKMVEAFSYAQEHCVTKYPRNIKVQYIYTNIYGEQIISPILDCATVQ